MKFRTPSKPQKGAESSQNNQDGNKPQRKFIKAKSAFRKFTNRKKPKSNDVPTEETSSLKSTTSAPTGPPPAPPPKPSDRKIPEKASMTLMETSTNSAATPAQHASTTTGAVRRQSGGSIPRASAAGAAGRRKSGGGKKYHGGRSKRRPSKDPIALDDPASRMYDQIPLLEVTKLPRGGISIETEAVGRVQFGIPPETIKDSMRLGLSVPSIYIVPVERFCREMGNGLGVNLAEFEFPAYFNFFIQKRCCTLIVDNVDAERNIKRVFSETLLGPAQFRRESNPIPYEKEDFAPDFPKEAIPDFIKELKHFRSTGDGNEIGIETLLKFCHFEGPLDSRGNDTLGVPPPAPEPEEKINGVGEGEIETPNGCVKEEDVVSEEKRIKTSIYNRLKFAKVAVVYPKGTSKEQIASRKCSRVEIFKFLGGSESDYVLHDVDENNIIIGRVKFSGIVRVSESLSVTGFGGDDEGDGTEDKIEGGDQSQPVLRSSSIPGSVHPPTFHPPSFGVTVLGNSHGFDRDGSTSGYVLWINGRGIMIDPPPYSSFTLEKEGIRPRTIVGIILTHCHADHDAGAFQKVLTGSPVVVITTPTIYKSFIRKYAALSALSPALLRHCHRHKPAIIGTPLRFQGATFHFTYTLHSIPCVGFKVVWRGRSMVFTGDHFNSPPAIDKLQEAGILSEARAQDLRNLPLQETDLLLHEAGAPPIHTPLDVLLALPQRVKDRLYVVHTQALPEGCELVVAPTGTAGTIRLDEIQPPHNGLKRSSTELPKRLEEGMAYEEDSMFQSLWSQSEYDTFGDSAHLSTYSNTGQERSRRQAATSIIAQADLPRVALRPTSSTDAWFILNLLSAVPFLSSLSYACTMEVLETARVAAFCMNDIVVPAARRSEVLCVVWEGTCMERKNICSERKGISRIGNGRRVSTFDLDLGSHDPMSPTNETKKKHNEAVWHAGDWTGPRSLQPEKGLSGENAHSKTHDIVAMSEMGVKVITVEFANLHTILKSGSPLYRTYLERKANVTNSDTTPKCLKGVPHKEMFEDNVRNLSVIEILECNSTLRKLTAYMKRHLESLAEGPYYYSPGQRLWRSGATVDKAFIVVAGTVSFVAKRRNAGSAGVGMPSKDKIGGSLDLEDDTYSSKSSTLGEMMRQDAAKVIAELGASQKEEDDYSSDSSISSRSIDETEGFHYNTTDGGGMSDGLGETQDYARLSLGLQRRADNMNAPYRPTKRDSASSLSLDDYSHTDFSYPSGDDEVDFSGDSIRTPDKRRNSSKERSQNKQLVRLYNRRAVTAGLVFSKGHFLGDISKMVAGLLSSTNEDDDYFNDDSSANYGFGEKREGTNNSRQGPIGEMIIHEQEGDQLIVHSSTLAAGKDGCVVLSFSSSKLIPFLDENPGLLLSLLGTQVVL